jgi:beta-keto acid cleavage enzyme
MKAAINGGRARAEHPAIPITLEEQAKDAAAVIAAGAGAIHLRVRGSDGRESLERTTSPLLWKRSAARVGGPCWHKHRRLDRSRHEATPRAHQRLVT